MFPLAVLSGGDGAYTIPNYGALVYCGLQGWMAPLKPIIKNNASPFHQYSYIPIGWLTEILPLFPLGYVLVFSCLIRLNHRILEPPSASIFVKAAGLSTTLSADSTSSYIHILPALSKECAYNIHTS